LNSGFKGLMSKKAAREACIWKCILVPTQHLV